MDLKSIVNKTELHRDIMRFFDENPASIDTPRGISTWVRGDSEKVKGILEELVALGILNAHKVTSTTGYSYTRNPKIIAQVKKALES
jgi:hypothetical protein